MRNEKNTEKKEERYTSALDYLEKNLAGLQEHLTDAVRQLHELNEDREKLQKDMKILTSEKLKNAAAQVFNSLTPRKRQIQEYIKEGREDMKWIMQAIREVKSNSK